MKKFIGFAARVILVGAVVEKVIDDIAAKNEERELDVWFRGFTEGLITKIKNIKFKVKEKE